MRNGLVVARGYGLKIYVHRKHLVVDDGIFATRQTRRFHRATSGLKRLVVIGHTGYITLEALRWIHDIGAAYLHIDADGQLIALNAAAGPGNAQLRRAQALAAGAPVGLEISRRALVAKIEGQGAVLARLQADERIRHDFARALHSAQHADDLTALLAAESGAASAYWQTWASVAVPFSPTDARRVPAHWLTFGQRHSHITGSPRLATNPPNAILNYLYALLQAETTLACQAIGLDPGLGFFHTDQRSRDSLALDLMETARPAVDAYLLALLTERRLQASDFIETRRGNCRIQPNLATQLAATAPIWREHVSPVVEATAKTLAAIDGRDVPTLLTQDNRREAWAASRSRPPRPRTPTLPASCRGCGTGLENRRRRYCANCLRDQTLKAGEAGRPAAATVLAHLRTDGRDPAHGHAAATARGTKNAAHQKALAKWSQQGEPMSDASEFRETILPGLRDASIAELVAATGLSEHYCSLIRLGKRVPHPRHWDALRSAER